jgi:hypothetical protein
VFQDGISGADIERWNLLSRRGTYTAPTIQKLSEQVSSLVFHEHDGKKIRACLLARDNIIYVADFQFIDELRVIDGEVLRVREKV